MESLAVKYRPKTWDDVVEQNSIKTILGYQLKTGTIKNAYLFVGSAGCGKTTCGRIFANEINNGQGTPIEIDAASHNGVDDVRAIIEDSKLQSIDSEYKCFILDECHMLSTQAWNAMLKLLEEPPEKSIFIMCTTNPEKIPQTILSRVQRYDFQKISTNGISKRLHDICVMEELAPVPDNGYTDAIEYIAKLADGGMRTAISLMDKCLSYSSELTVQNVVAALGVADYTEYFALADALLASDARTVIETLEGVKSSGKDSNQFSKGFLGFCMDICKYCACRDFKYIRIPNTYEDKLKSAYCAHEQLFKRYVGLLVHLNSEIRYELDAFTMLEATLYLECDNV